jgi:hypothetical protein
MTTRTRESIGVGEGATDRVGDDPAEAPVHETADRIAARIVVVRRIDLSFLR